ncbi:sensor histidine kinase [Bradyrhizobium sp. INPA01-394B]|uniref:histidine kinase n=1 Tax=Bradyrhizobium campsiandrae TaxID=1729892 RepID=A0ABR7U2B1_9BRAD|nr:sensor histidine kinase [Bradyrhizobium campsiandrae]MBC9877716.1 sensor histidine kinase [Bradyrhizobium campsiandrae]MBC9977728.1 sensor histidine kinase [Bradyrhizobium campsiandrae]
MHIASHTSCDEKVYLPPEFGGTPANEELFLVQELTHRFNNDLAALTGFVSLAAARSVDEEVKLAMAGVLQRLFDLASTQRALRVPIDQSVDCAGYLAGLCRSISAAKLQYRDIELEFLDAPLSLNSFECWRVGMIVAELINNAARHAFGDRGGKIQVAMTDRGCSMEVTVADNGRGLDDFSEGQGTKIVRHLASVLKATLDYRSTPSGTIARLSVPLAGDQIKPAEIAASPKNSWRILQDGDLENEATESFATTAPSVGGRTSATPQRSKHD